MNRCDWADVTIMASKAPREGINEAELKIGKPKTSSVGLPAVVHALKIAQEQMGPVRAAKALLAVNQVKGFDCPGCAFPEPEKRSHAEFCENGAKAVAEEATRRRVEPSFFREHSVAELRQKDDFWLGQQGRLTHPMLLDDGGTHYRPVSWDEAFGVIGDELRGLDSPAGLPMRPRSHTSCSSGGSAPTSCRTVPTCATSPAATR
jgi:anaerobic selenocysteine-containing dehydrogenase